MKKAWVYISTFLTGVIAGIIVGAKFLGVEKVTYQIKKLRAKDGAQIHVKGEITRAERKAARKNK